jgi:hypothetical protein
MPAIEKRVADVLASGVTQVSRRAEIYESDGVTLFNDTPRLVDGNISVDMSRAERRALDITFDNSDGSLNHDPSGFWYDKVIKVFRGTNWTSTQEQPKIIIVQNQTDIVPDLRRVGYTDINSIGTASVLGDLTDYDIAIGNASTVDLTLTNSYILSQAYDSGMSVLTISDQATQSSVPLMTASATKTLTETWGATPNVLDNYFSGSWTAFTMGSTATGVVPTALLADVVTVGEMTASSVVRPVLFYKENRQTGGRWFHIQLPWNSNTGSKVLLAKVIDWLFTAKGAQSWETQVGEFCIDRIVEPRFPKQIKVTGRDYAKKLLGAKITDSLMFSTGTLVDTIVRALAANAGITKFHLGLTGAQINDEILFERGTERWNVIQKLVEAAGGEVYFDPGGYLSTRYLQDPYLSAPSLVLATGSVIGNLVDYEKSSNDTRIYNRVVVTADSGSQAQTGVTMQAIASNTDPNSPTRIAVSGTPGGLNERTYFYTSAFFTAQAQLDSYALKLLKFVALEEFELSFSAVPFYWSDAGDILQFVDPDAGGDEPTRFLLTNFSMPLGLGPMTGTGKRVTRVGAAT